MRYSQKRFLFFVFSLVIIFVLTFVIVKNYTRPLNNQAADPSSEPIPTQTPESSEVFTPDGTLKLIINRTNLANGDFSYSFFTQTSDDENRKLIFTSTGPEGMFTLSPNSWSPDNLYVFLLKKVNNTTNALVFKASGETIAQNQQYIDLSPLFEKNSPDEIIINVTGWDSTTLVHVVAKNIVEGKTSAYWFDIIPQAFYKL